MIKFMELYQNHFINSHFNIFLLLGIAIFGGTIGGSLFKKIRIPQVVGYIIIGLILGENGLGFIKIDVINNLRPVNYFALGIISFLLGGELYLKKFFEMGKQFIGILLLEVAGAFLLVSISVYLISSFLFSQLTAVIIALLLGSIASATAAAGTTDVLAENRAKGPLTTTLIGLIAFDDILALILFTIMSSVGIILTGSENGLMLNIITPVYEIILSILLGGLSGFFLTFFIKRFTEEDHIFVFIIGFIIIILGLAILLKLDMLLTAMFLGMVLINTAPEKKCRKLFNLIERFSSPINVLFFVFVGASIQIMNINWKLLIIISVFIISRIIGKTIGIKSVSLFSKVSKVITKYLPLTLLSQSGVAIGLSIIAQQRFQGVIGDNIIVIVTTSTFIVQIAGPIFLKRALYKSGESGKNITLKDIKKQIQIDSVLSGYYPVLHESDNMDKILSFFEKYEYQYFPVLDSHKKVTGIISFDNIRKLIVSKDLNYFLIALDIMSPLQEFINKSITLYEAESRMQISGTDYICVLGMDNKFQGIIDRWKLNSFAHKAFLLESHKGSVYG